MARGSLQHRQQRQQSEARGRRAESLAAWYLRLKGYSLLSMRFRSPVGEIDLVARRGDLLIFVEVKSRATASDALASLGNAQMQRIVRASQFFLKVHPNLSMLNQRFDVIAIGPYWPHHIEDAWRPNAM